MIRASHLECYTLQLTTRSPLFIGSGREYNRKAYIYNPQARTATFLDSDAFMSLIVEMGLVEAYERFIFDNRPLTLAEFVRNNRISRAQIGDMTLYTADASHVFADGRAMEVKQFVRDHRHCPYIPGSSVKGALRTALLNQLIREHPMPNANLSEREPVDRVEQQYLHTLSLMQNKPYDMVNSTMRGISISDSAPLPSGSLALYGKEDYSVQGNVKCYSIVWECVPPGTPITMTLTIDRNLAKGIDASLIRRAITEYGANHKRMYEQYFKLPADTVDAWEGNCIMVGGGSGYFSKNIVYTLLRRDDAVKYVAKFMQDKFKGHHHECDVGLRISPHRYKLTTHNMRHYPYGICSIELT